jgi:hypothetical protein
MFIPFTPHFVGLKEETLKELIKEKILRENPSLEYKNFLVIAMDIKTEKQNIVDKEKYDEEDEEDIKYKEIEVAEIMLLIGIPNYGYHWLNQEDIIFVSS